ncbi:MAG TPA: HAD-IA family hydrolase [Gammaproteobacteria bacterium]
MQQIKTVLFDLDGTLIDTAPDMAHALNLLLEEEQCDTLPYEAIRPVVSNGSAALVELGFAGVSDPAELARLKQRYLDIYQANLCVHSTLFPGMAELIDQLELHRRNWGVVTNKPGWLTDPLMRQLDLYTRAACVISGDTTANRKPHPEPMYLACKQAGSTGSQCLYIGDAQRDIQAGRNAGMQTMIACYGYIGDWENIDDWGADYRIEQPLDVLDLLELTSPAL